MHNKTPCSRLLRMHLLLHCVDLCSKLHILEAGEAPWKQRGLLMAFPFSHQVFGTLRGYLLFRRICLATRFYVCMLVQCTGKVLCCHNYFFVNCSFQICLERQTICELFVAPIFRKKVRATISSISICSDFISYDFKNVSRASFNARSSSSFMFQFVSVLLSPCPSSFHSFPDCLPFCEPSICL